MVRRPFEIQVARRETEPLEITVDGKTTKIVFEIVDTKPNKDMIAWNEAGVGQF